MIIYKGKHSGFCFGVKRAVDTALSFKEGNNFLLGEIIHNQSVNQALINNGLKIVKNEELESLPKGYIWVDYGTLNYLVQVNNCLNIQLRNLLSLIKL